MNYILKDSDKNVVSNIRFGLKDSIKRFSDEQIAEQWRHFSQSVEYDADDKNAAFLKWMENSYD